MRLVVGLLWRGPGNILNGKNSADDDGLLLKHQISLPLPIIDASFKHVKLHYCRVQQAKPCHKLGRVARRSSWAIELSALRLNNNTETPDSVV